ncbi:MAG TPA: ATP-binding protein [Pseudonocardiaceae bacterium]|jgi:serine/threonine-protein kinase RsbW
MNDAGSAASQPGSSDIAELAAIELRLTAGSEYLSTVRAVAADLALQQDMTLDEVDDLRLAVDEACSMLVPLAAPGAELRCRFSLAEREIRVRCSVPASTPELPPTDGFPWQVLMTLADSVRAHVERGTGDGDVVWIELAKQKVDRA